MAVLATFQASCTASIAASGAADKVPTEAQVESLLVAAYEARVNPEELCELATSDLNCEASLEFAPAASEQAPILKCTDVLDAPEGQVDGTLARVQGVDGDGREIDSTLLAIKTGEGVRFVDPVYWAPSGISTGNTTDESSLVKLDC